MNIKSLRRNYEQLTMLERLSLADNALARDDESEILAIKAASPGGSYTQPDFYNLLSEITRLRLCNLIVRLGYAMNFDFFMLTGREKLKNLSHSDGVDTIFDDAKMTAFLYVRETDSWEIVSNELCLRTDFDEEIGGLLFSVHLLKKKDKIMRKMAFTEGEAIAFIKKTGKGELRTTQEEAEAIRVALGLSES